MCDSLAYQVLNKISNNVLQITVAEQTTFVQVHQSDTARQNVPKSDLKKSQIFPTFWAKLGPTLGPNWHPWLRVPVPVDARKTKAKR